MSISHLNFFVPFERSPASHENQLTRAFLVVLRNSPMAHQTWLRLVSPEHALQELPIAEFATQRPNILPPNARVADGEAIPGISVWLAPDAAPVTSPVEPSDRQQMLDGIITYGTDLVIVIENKVARGDVTEQPHKLNLHGSPVRFAPKVVEIQWQKLLGLFSGLVERELVTGAERWIISDFLDLVEEHFPTIGPYSTLAQCGDQPFRVDRRLDTILGEVTGAGERKTLGWRDIHLSPKLPMVWLGFSVDKSAVHLSAYPADTLAQARVFFPTKRRSRRFSRSNRKAGTWHRIFTGASWRKDWLNRSRRSALKTTARIGFAKLAPRGKFRAPSGRRMLPSWSPRRSSMLRVWKNSTPSSRIRNERKPTRAPACYANTSGRWRLRKTRIRKRNLSLKCGNVSMQC